MKRLIFAVALLGLTGCVENRYDPSDKPLEGVVADVRFNLGEEINCCQVEFKDGRVVYFRNGAGFLFKKGATNRIYRMGNEMIEAVEIVGPEPGR